MIALEWLNFATHVASQLCGVYFEQLNIAPQFDSDFLNGKDILESERCDWERLIHSDLHCVFPSLSWLQRFLDKKCLSIETFVMLIMRQIELALARHAHIVVISDMRYPKLLREISDPPLSLFVEGDDFLLNSEGVAVIGSRKASGFALEESFLMGQMLAKANINVVSGGAIGCDIAAHRGVLSLNAPPGKAIVVLAGGLDQLFPRVNLAFFKKIIDQGGAILSERLWGAPCRPRDFPIRNRIISGMSEFTAVMQAADKSGAMVTARMSLDQSRDVIVLEHPPDDLRATGSQSLIADGALKFKSHLEILDIVNGGLT